MTQVYRTLRVAPGGEGVLGVVVDAPPMNLIGPELVRDLVSLLGKLESGEGARVMVLESADPEYFIPHVDLTKVAEYTAEAAKAGGMKCVAVTFVGHHPEATLRRAGADLVVRSLEEVSAQTLRQLLT